MSRYLTTRAQSLLAPAVLYWRQHHPGTLSTWGYGRLLPGDFVYEQYQSINQWRWQTQAHLSLYVRMVLKTLVLISNNLCIKLRSISGTGKVGSVTNFHILELPKVIKSRLKCINRVNINYSTRKVFQILTVLLGNENFQRSLINASNILNPKLYTYTNVGTTKNSVILLYALSNYIAEPTRQLERFNQEFCSLFYPHYGIFGILFQLMLLLHFMSKVRTIHGAYWLDHFWLHKTGDHNLFQR